MTVIPEILGTVLVVDNDPGVVVLVHTILTAAGYRVLHATECEDAVRLASQTNIRIDLALLDINVAGVTETALAEEIISYRPNIRVLWMSGFIDNDFIRIKLVDGISGVASTAAHRAGLLAAVNMAFEGAPNVAWAGRPKPRTFTAGASSNWA